MAVVFAFRHGTVVDQRAERPAMQSAIGGTGGLQRQFVLRA